jgi:hypothetical protein
MALEAPRTAALQTLPPGNSLGYANLRSFVRWEMPNADLEGRGVDRLHLQEPRSRHRHVATRELNRNGADTNRTYEAEELNNEVSHL